MCGGELEMETGKLESPNYPEDYQPKKECVWRITVPEGFQVALKFQSFEVRFKKTILTYLCYNVAFTHHFGVINHSMDCRHLTCTVILTEMW